MIGAAVAGFSAHLVDRLLANYLPTYLGALSAEQRREVERMQRDVRAAADLYLAAASVTGSAEVAVAEVGAGSGQEEISVVQASDLLGCSARWVRALALQWEPLGLARKVGVTWLLDRTAVLTHRDERRRSA